uniref:Dihydroorotate oxidase B, electron transfer subunit n=1 Tax=Candidatus Kentrum sp. MB TaxID=2138164 RepID=A0A451B7D3_9GAMM|nr:MAG: dihydroorotate oxidase B, electron transfer subunit [Candidatus Kentron sp. MB]VFK28315.1 MAG: dihydroorotate oxidase B, electron transfer subunit [Candidatus Kentron sp. MB]VFK74202.1 MAG: dihydroorotate oxidase B, electron transfer subunit [Candidatus Kentron sp. MB]
MQRSQQASLFIEEAKILYLEPFTDERFQLRLAAPRIAATASPGAFLHVRCDSDLPLRRPFSLMGADPDNGHVTILIKVVGQGTRLLAARRVGDIINVIGPIGVPFRPLADRPRALLLGGGLGMPPLIFLADRLRMRPSFRPLLFIGSEISFPFLVRPSQIRIPELPHGVTDAMAPAEEWGIPSRLASRQGYSGCFHGLVTELAQTWLAAQSQSTLGETALYACGPSPMLRATARLARRYDLPCQVCLEEFMACGVGACAGCVTPVTTEAGPAMKRVCVDGPVFDAREVF